MASDITACWVGVALNKESRELCVGGAASTRAELVELMKYTPIQHRFTFALSDDTNELSKRMMNWLSRNGVADEAIVNCVEELNSFLMDVLCKIRAAESNL